MFNLKILEDMTIKLKLIILIAVSLVAMSFIAFNGLSSMKDEAKDIDNMYSRHVATMESLAEVRSNALLGNLYALQLFNEESSANKDKLKANIKELGEKNKPNFAKLEEFCKDDAQLKEAMDNLHKERILFVEHRNKMVDLIDQGNKKEAYEEYVNKVIPKADDYLLAINKTFEYASNTSKEIHENAMTNSAQAELLMEISFVIAIIILFVIGYLITTSIINPLTVMVEKCKTIASGDLKFKEDYNKIRTDRKDEIGILSHELETLRKSLNDIVEKIRLSSTSVTDASNQLSINSEQCAQAITQVAESINSVAMGANEQNVAVQDSENKIHDLKEELGNVTIISENVAKKEEESTITISDGEKKVNKVISQMDNINITVEQTSTVIDSLYKKSQEINTIIATIKGIAQQTNLLALNAAIEAAHAGEQGKGFTVVAEEVRKLAEQSQESVDDVSKLISDIQKDTEQASVSMRKGLEEVEKGKLVVNETGKAFAKINNIVKEIDQDIVSINVSIAKMNGYGQNIVSATEIVKKHSARNLDETQTVSAASEEQSASMSEISTSSRNLATLSEELMKSVNTFDLDKNK